MFRKILIANRGEIAVRIIRACKEMGILSAVVFSEADRSSLHVRLADEAYAIGPAPSTESYLVVDKIIEAAQKSKSEAIHPGYGFLAENPLLARACITAGITFIGPSPDAMEKLGSKTAARHLAKAVGVPTVPGTLDPIERFEDGVDAARKIGFPVVFKAVAGGGGKGMRLIEREADMQAGWRDASSESLRAFGDGRLYLEKYLARPRHIEIQILGDNHGHILHLGERECSVQRRHQKVMEEAPSPIMTPDLRSAMGEAAVKLARAGGYANAGTVEFLVDAGRNFYFLEVNTRLQVEHPVTELVTSLDLVKLQIEIASGQRLRLKPEDIQIRGHAIECRIYAEDPDNNFAPSPGKILQRRVPSGPGIRLDDGAYAGWTIPNEYDPLLGKLIAWGGDRAEAIARLRRAIGEYYVMGIRANVGLFRRILDSQDFQSAAIYTRWLDDFLILKTIGKTAEATDKDAALIALAMLSRSQSTPPVFADTEHASHPISQWKLGARREQLSRVPGE